MWYDFLPKLLNMSITGGILILVVLVLRLVLRRAPKAFSYALWAVVLFRLLCPVTLSSPVSVLNAAPVSGGRVEFIPAGAFYEITAPVPAAAQARPVPVLPYIWLAGAAVPVLYSVVQLVRLRRQLVGATCLVDNIYLADHIPSPFVTGLFRPKIYLPSGLTEAERGYILLHEQFHIRRLDHITRALAFLALCLHWFNPLVWVAFVVSGSDMEMSCDEAVMKKLGGEIRQDYSRSLLSLTTGRRIIAGTPLAFGEGNTKRRIQNVLNYKKPAFWVILAAVIVCVIAAVCLLTDPAAPEVTVPTEPSAPTQPAPTEPAPDESAPREAIADVFAQGDPAFTLHLANGGPTRSFGLTDWFSDRFQALASCYHWSDLAEPAPYPSTYWLTLTSADGSRVLTFWEDNTVQYAADGEVCYWTVKFSKKLDVDSYVSSITKVMRAYYGVLEADPTCITLEAGSSQEAAAMFMQYVYWDHMRGQTPGSSPRLDRYELIDFERVAENSSGTAVQYHFRYAYTLADPQEWIIPVYESIPSYALTPEGPDSPETWPEDASTETEGTGEFQGMYIVEKDFVLQLQEDGLWHCLGVGRNVTLPE